MKVRFIILLVLAASLVCDSRDVGITNLFIGAIDSEDSVLKVNNPYPDREAQNFKEVDKKENVCTLCEEFTAEALNYFAANKTQTEIVHILHKSCSKLHSFRQECLTLVDYYAPLFFLEISSVQPGEFCQKVNLCEQAVLISQHLRKDSCEFCQQTVREALLKLKDPNTLLEIIQVLLKGCHAVKGYEKQCKRMIFEYGPIILANAEHLLESNDVCTMIHACELPKANSNQALTGETMVLATS